MKGQEVWIVVDDYVLEVFDTRQEAIDYIQPWRDKYPDDPHLVPDYYSKTIGEPWEPALKIVGGP